MDQERFDRFTKALATGQSRRSVLRGMGASLAAAVAGLGLREASADHNHGRGGGGGPKPGRCGLPGQPCKFNKQCCPDSVCLDGYCTCPAGQELVDGTCVPTCPAGQELVDGVCCPAGQTVVNGVCCDGVPGTILGIGEVCISD